MDATVKTEQEVEQERIAERSAELKEKFKSSLQRVCAQYAEENDFFDYRQVTKSDPVASRAVAHINHYHGINVMHLHYHQELFYEAMDEFFDQ